jgi:tRNA(adenine34) deaminase
MCYFAGENRKIPGDTYYMQVALAEARSAASEGETPVGAVIVKDDKIIARAHNKRETCRDATAHAELLAVREACAVLGAWRLTGCTIYVTLEPCPMCAGALVMSRIEKLVYACPDSRAGAAESLFNITDSPLLNHRVKVRCGVLETEARALLQEFFQTKRK